MREARVTARFSHPHIVTIYGVGTHDSQPYVALEYLDGATLRQRYRESPPGVKEALRVGLAIAEALAKAHEHQFLHRDLKPENVIVPSDGRVRVVDFGLARPFAVADVDDETVDPDETLDGSHDSGDALQEAFASEGNRLAGTPRYMAPEQWQQAPCSGATDV